MKKVIFVSAFLLFSAVAVRAQDINIVFTGETRGALYYCHCPVQPDGGLSRRATKIKELRSANPKLLLVDTGDLFAGGPVDYNAQNTDLDKKRTLVTLAAMKLMQYDAVAIGYDEFNFGKEFIQEQVNKAGLHFVSGNIKLNNVLPFVIKDVSGVKCAILALTTLQAKDKAPQVEFSDPQFALKETLAQVKKKGADIVILLTNFKLGEEQALIKQIPGVDVLIATINQGDKAIDKIGSAIVLQPVREGRRLGQLTLSVKDKKIIDYKKQEIRLSDQIKDDPQVAAIVPVCFSDRDCPKKEGSVSQCKNAGELTSVCEFNQLPKVALTVIRPKSCVTCDVERQVTILKQSLGNVEVTYIEHDSQKGRDVLKEIGLDVLPLFLLSKDFDNNKSFFQLKDKLELKGNYYVVKPNFIGISYLAGRKRQKGAFDLFISLFDKNTPELITIVMPFNPRIHFLAIEDKETGAFQAPYGAAEIEEDLRSVCAMDNYPDKAPAYLACRAKNINSTWWEDCAVGMDLNRIRSCARSEKGNELLKENTKLGKELQVFAGPTYLLSNQEIFSSKLNPKTEELKKIIEGQK